MQINVRAINGSFGSFASLFLCVSAILLFLQGCAGDKLLVRQELAKVPSLQAVYDETPVLRIRTLSGGIVHAAMGPLIKPLHEVVTTSREDQAQAQIPDFGYLVMRRFAESVAKQEPRWPVMTVAKGPLKSGEEKKGAVLHFETDRLVYAFLVGVVTETTVVLKDDGGEVLWRRHYRYQSDQHDRKRTIEEFEADNYRLLREELEFAAERTVADLLSHLAGGPVQVSR